MAGKTKKPSTSPSPEQSLNPENRKRPVEIKVGSSLVKIWENEQQDGTGVWYNVTVANLYREGEEWRQGHSFTKKDIPNLIEALEQANRRLNGVTVSTPGEEKTTKTRLDVSGQTKQIVEHNQDAVD